MGILSDILARKRAEEQQTEDLEAQRRATLPLLRAQGREAGLSQSRLGGLGTLLGSAQSAGELVATAGSAQSMLDLPGVSPVAAVQQQAGISAGTLERQTKLETLETKRVGTAQARLDFQTSQAEARERFGQDALNARLASQQKLAEDAARQNAGLPVAGVNQRIMFNPYSRQDQLTPLAGTPGYQAEQGKIDAQQQLMTEIQRMKDLIELAGPTGTDFTGENAARMQRQQAAISLAFKNAEDLGALQEADIALVKAGMIDPTGFFENLEALGRSSVGGLFGFFSSGQKPVILAGYDQAMERIFDQLETQFKNHPYLRIDQTRINPEFRDRLVPSQ